MKARWERLFDGKLFVNKTEGKIKINKKVYLFSDIKGTELNSITGYKTEQNGKETSKTVKHASLGGAVMGGLVAGSVGALAGATSLGKTKTNTNETIISNGYPICFHLGVFINLNNFISEVVFISSEVEQSSKKYNNAYVDALNFILQLNALAQTPVPQNVLKPENAKSVQNFNVLICNKQNELQTIIGNNPTYKIPLKYRLEETINLSDKEYLEYLLQRDKQRKLEYEKGLINKKESKMYLQNIKKRSLLQKIMLFVSLIVFLLSMIIFESIHLLWGILFLLNAMAMLILSICNFVKK